MEQQTPTALVTGGNRGIGRETVRRLADLGWTVWLGSRDPAAGRRAAEGLAGDVRVVALDVTSDDSVAAAAEQLRTTGLDVLVNNAAAGGRGAAPEDCRPADFAPVYAVNVVGPVRVTHALLPLLHRSAAPRIVNVSSGGGSIGITNDPARPESALHELVYLSSKTALNMITTQYARALPRFRVNAVDPGYTATALNGYRGTQTVEEGAEPVVRAATLPDDGPTSTFFGRHGTLPW